MDALAALLAEQERIELLSASDLHARISLLEDLHARILLLEEATRACRTELLRRPTHCQEPPSPQPAATTTSCMLLQLSHDEMGMVAHELCDPLWPLLAVNLSSTAKGLREPMQAALAELKKHHQEAGAFVALMKQGRGTGTWEEWEEQPAPRLSIEELSRVTEVNTNQGEFTLAQWKGLGTLIGCGSLPMLTDIGIDGSGCGDEGLPLLAAGLSRGGLPSLTSLSLAAAGTYYGDGLIGDQAAGALAAALTKQPMPALRVLELWGNQIGDTGLLALVPVLRQMPKLEVLIMYNNPFSDHGFAALIAQPMTGVLESLKILDIGGSVDLSDTSCVALTSALRSGGLPALDQVSLHGSESEPFSRAHEEIFAARDGLGPTDDFAHLLVQ